VTAQQTCCHACGWWQQATNSWQQAAAGEPHHGSAWPRVAPWHPSATCCGLAHNCMRATAVPPCCYAMLRSVSAATLWKLCNIGGLFGGRLFISGLPGSVVGHQGTAGRHVQEHGALGGCYWVREALAVGEQDRQRFR